jgi:RNA polymerase sigma-70 factor (ECF subfamily)
MEKVISDRLSPPDTWVDEYSDYLYSYALYRISDSDAAEDLVQDTFTAALAARSRFKGKSSEKTWLTSILKNKIIDFFRKRYREKTDLVEDIDKFSLDQFFDDRDNWAIKPQKWLQNPQKKFENSEFMNILQKCLEKISPKQADAFRLREISQFDTEEICKVLNISTTNYWVLMHRARLYMRRCLEIRWFSPESGESNL